jgi:hypothetical protein
MLRFPGTAVAVLCMLLAVLVRGGLFVGSAIELWS